MYVTKLKSLRVSNLVKFLAYKIIVSTIFTTYQYTKNMHVKQLFLGVRFARRMMHPVSPPCTPPVPLWLPVEMKCSAKCQDLIPMIPFQRSPQGSGWYGVTKEPLTTLTMLQV